MGCKQEKGLQPLRPLAGQANSKVPPACGKDPAGFGVDDPPEEDEGGGDQQSKDLVAAEDARLLSAPRELALLLIMRLDAGENH